MKRTLIDRIPISLSGDVEKFVHGARIYDSSCSPEARVYYLERDCGYYLKIADAGTLGTEAEMTRFFHSKGLGTEVMLYESTNKDYFITKRVVGEDLTHSDYLSNPERLSERLGEELRRLHETDFKGCPVMNRTETYLAAAERNYKSGNYDKSHFPDSFGYKSAAEAYTVLNEGKGELKCDTLIHGDYCLPNIMLNNWKLSAFIDVGCGGVSDRHIDLFWGAWTLMFNLGTDRYKDRFFDAYGRDNVNNDLLKVVAAAEVFG